MGGCGSKKASGGELILTEQDDSQRDINREVKRERETQKDRQMNTMEET